MLRLFDFRGKDLGRHANGVFASKTRIIVVMKAGKARLIDLLGDFYRLEGTFGIQSSV